MARPCRCRRICSQPAYDSFVPQGTSCGENIVLTVDEYEVIRLIDLDKLTHEQCAKQMDISRTTVTEIYESARQKLADSIVNGKTLVISGGNYRLCDGSASEFCQKKCNRNMQTADIKSVLPKGDFIMRIAVTYENGNVFQHFGHSAQFKLYDAENGKVENEQVVDTNGSGHGALAGLLSALNVDVLICGGIGGGAQTALAQAGIKLYGGVNGSADMAVMSLLNGTLDFNPNVMCSHHSAEHSCGSHSCGENKNGCSGN